MSYRGEARDLAQEVDELRRKIRQMEQAGCCPPDPGWVLAETPDGLHFLYVPSGAIGPTIGVK